MENGYTIRISDGSEIGPMDLKTVRGWFQQGLLTASSPVLAPGSKRWKSFGEVFGSSARNRSAGNRAQTAARRRPGKAVTGRGAARRPAHRSASGGSGRLMPVLGAAAAVAVLATGVYAAWHSGLFGGRVAEEIREWATRERSFADETLGVSLDLPGGWVILNESQPLVSPPPGARVVLARARGGGFGYLLAEAAPQGVYSLDDFIKGHLPQRRPNRTAVKVADESPLPGDAPGRQVQASWEEEGIRYQDVAAVWKNGRTMVTLLAWSADDGAADTRASLRALVSGVSLDTSIASVLSKAVATATRELPHLNPQTAEMVMSQSAAGVLDAPETFRRSYQLASHGLRRLNKRELREMGQLTRTVYSSMSSRSRRSLAGYFDQVRVLRPTRAERDRDMSRLMKSAVLKLPAKGRTRLQELYEKAVRATVATSS